MEELDRTKKDLSKPSLEYPIKYTPRYTFEEWTRILRLKSEEGWLDVIRREGRTWHYY